MNKVTISRLVEGVSISMDVRSPGETGYGSDAEYFVDGHSVHYETFDRAVRLTDGRASTVTVTKSQDAAAMWFAKLRSYAAFCRSFRDDGPRERFACALDDALHCWWNGWSMSTDHRSVIDGLTILPCLEFEVLDLVCGLLAEIDAGGRPALIVQRQAASDAARMGP